MFGASGKLNVALRGFTISLAANLTGAVLELLALVAFYNAILLADFTHWMLDTIVEVLYIVFVRNLRKSARRFHYGIIVQETLMLTLAGVAVIGAYVILLARHYFMHKDDLELEYPLWLSVVPVIGGLLNSIVMVIQRENYLRTRLESIKADYKHAKVDVVSSLLASAGIAVVGATRNTAYEVAFVLALSVFVGITSYEILATAYKTMTGKNADQLLASKLKQKIESEIKHGEVECVEASKLGSFYIVTVHTKLPSDLTLREVHEIKEKVVSLAKAESDLIVKVDFLFKPSEKLVETADERCS